MLDRQYHFWVPGTSAAWGWLNTGKETELLLNLSVGDYSDIAKKEVHLDNRFCVSNSCPLEIGERPCRSIKRKK
ncbi:hypothetical protein GN956_G17150 [Arapaima gigas]